LENNNKLYNLEITPPDAVWNKISAELDDAELSSRFPSALYALEEAPPAQAWQNIAAALDEPTFESAYAAKLSVIEVTPPATTWNKIQRALDTEHEAAIPDHRRLSPLLKYAAAAVITGLLAWAGYSLLNNKKEMETVAKKDPPAVPEKKNTIVIPTEEAAMNEPVVASDRTNSTSTDDDARNEAALEASKKTYAKLDINTNSKIKEAANFYFGKSGTTRDLDFGNENSIPSHKKDTDRYIMLMTPDGNIIRMSKKLSNMICCVSGEEQDEECKDQMKKWQEKMANSSAGHSPGNLIDILSLLNNPEEDEKF